MWGLSTHPPESDQIAPHLTPQLQHRNIQLGRTLKIIQNFIPFRTSPHSRIARILRISNFANRAVSMSFSLESFLSLISARRDKTGKSGEATKVKNKDETKSLILKENVGELGFGVLSFPIPYAEFSRSVASLHFSPVFALGTSGPPQAQYQLSPSSASRYIHDTSDSHLPSSFLWSGNPMIHSSPRLSFLCS